MPEGRRRPRSGSTAFWDTSAIVPLCCYQVASAKARQIARTYGWQVVWWVTPVEVVSAFQRLMREGHISNLENAQSLARLAYLRRSWSEVQPNDELRVQAERLLRMQSLRAADALQLAAALVWCSNRPRDRTFIVADRALAAAAQIEGFTVISL